MGVSMAATRAEFLLLDLIINATCRCHERKSPAPTKGSHPIPQVLRYPHLFHLMLNPFVSRRILMRRNKTKIELYSFWKKVY